MTVDEMIAAIEQQTTIRELWRCNAGWGMFTLTEDEVAVCYSDSTPRARRPRGTVQQYYPTLEDCVRAEYLRWVGDVGGDS